MAYSFASIEFSTYNINAGRHTGSNIAIKGCFDLPFRNGKTFHEWGDEHGIEAFTESSDLMFKGRDILFTGFLMGDDSIIQSSLNSFYNDIKAASGLEIFSTPYGDFNTYVENIKAYRSNGACELEIIFKEPVVNLTGGSLPPTGIADYTIDSIPFASFGLYLNRPEKLFDLPKMKEMYYSKYGEEGYQITKRTHEILKMNCFLLGSDFSDFQDKVQSLYLLFSSSGTRYINLNNEIYKYCFADEGFEITKVNVVDSLAYANFKIDLKVTA